MNFNTRVCSSCGVLVDKQGYCQCNNVISFSKEKKKVEDKKKKDLIKYIINNTKSY